MNTKIELYRFKDNNDGEGKEWISLKLEIDRLIFGTYNNDQWPSSLIVQKLQIVSLYVQQTADHQNQQEDQKHAGIVRWAKDFNLWNFENFKFLKFFAIKKKRELLKSLSDLKHLSLITLISVRSLIHLAICSAENPTLLNIENKI